LTSTMSAPPLEAIIASSLFIGLTSNFIKIL
jgi:hypothetical protein